MARARLTSTVFYANDTKNHRCYWDGQQFVCENDDGVIRRDSYLCSVLTTMHMAVSCEEKKDRLLDYAELVPARWTVGRKGK